MSKVLALDLGNEWTGSALSDLTRMFAKPYQTVRTAELHTFIVATLATTPIDIIVVGHPQTMKGTASAQTLLVEKQFEELKNQYTTVQWYLWDERLTSKRASALKPARTAEERRKSHSLAAAFILDSFLTFLSTQEQK